MELDNGTGLIAVALATFGAPLILLADRLSGRVGRIGQVLIVYPIGALGFLSLAGIAALIVLNIIGPVALQSGACSLS